MSNLKQNFETAANNYLKAFCEKHEFDYEDAKNSWVGNDVGGITCIGDFYVGLDTIRIDIDKNAPINEFVEWYDYTLRVGMLSFESPTPNYEHWLMGCPRLSEKEIVMQEECHRAYLEQKEGLIAMIKEIHGDSFDKLI